MADPRPPLDLIPAFEALSTLVDAASVLAGELRDDPLLGRWMAVLARMPVADRKTILEVVEREVTMRNASEAGANVLMGFRVTHPNPNARLYARVATPEAPSYVSTEEIEASMLRIARSAHAMLRGATSVHPRWEEVAIETGDRLPPEELEALEWYGQLLVSLVERIRARRTQSGAA